MQVRAGQPEPHIELQELRVNRGWSRADLAARIGVTEKTVRMAEYGFRPGARIQFKIARQFGMKPTELWPIEVEVRR